MAKKKEVVDVQIKPNDKVLIEWTNSSFHEKGEFDEVHPVHAAKLIHQGRAKMASKEDSDTLRIEQDKEKMQQVAPGAGVAVDPRTGLPKEGSAVKEGASEGHVMTTENTVKTVKT